MMSVKAEKEKSGMYGGDKALRVGRFDLYFFDGKEENGIWLEDTEAGEAAQFRGKPLEKALEELWKGF